MYDLYCLVFALYQAVIVKFIAVPPHLGVASVLTGKSPLVEAYHPKKEALRSAVTLNVLQLLEADPLLVEQWIHEALLLVLMR